VFNVLVIIDGSPETAREWDAVETTFRRLHAQASGVVRVRWSVALGSPGDPVVLELGGAERVEDPPDVALLLDAAQRALTSGRTGDPLGAAVQALDRLQPGQPGRWSVLVISARDGRVIDPASLATRVDVLDFQVGGAMCSAPPTPVLDAMAAALGAQLRTVCEPAPHLGDTGIVPRFALALSQAAALGEHPRRGRWPGAAPARRAAASEHWWAAPGHDQRGQPRGLRDAAPGHADRRALPDLLRTGRARLRAALTAGDFRLGRTRTPRPRPRLLRSSSS
jgi:hypothetical protein